MSQTQSQKEADFQKFVAHTLFPVSDYEVVQRTNSLDENSKQHAEEGMLPKNKFRCKKTDKAFYVEAKFYADFTKDEKLDVFNFLQLERLKSLERLEGVPVFVVIGYLGLPAAPEYLSLIPIEELSNLKLDAVFLERFAIKKTLVSPEKLGLKKQEITPKETPMETAKLSEDRSFQKNKMAYAIMGLAITIFLSLGFKTTHKYAVEKQLRQKTSEYYALIEKGNLDALENYLSPSVQKWYNTSNVNFEQIKADALAYQKENPNTTTTIEWDTFQFIPMPNDEYKVSYNVVYKIESPETQKDKTFHLKINVTWGEDFKIKSIFENVMKS